MGSRADRERAAAKARSSRVASHGSEVPAATCVGSARGGRRWSTFLRNHARGVIACDFLVAVASTFRVLYVLVIIEHHSRRLIHFKVTAHPTAKWTRQQLQEAVGYEERYECLLHDRDAIFSTELDESIRRLGRVEESAAQSKGELHLRTGHRNDSQGVFGLDHSALGRASASDAQRLGDTLQPRTPSHSVGPGVPDPPVDIRCRCRSRGIDSLIFAPCMPKHHSAGCTTSTRWRLCDQNKPSQDRSDEVLADHRKSPSPDLARAWAGLGGPAQATQQYSLGRA